jgi:phosphatidylglycerophosphatase A
MRNEGIDVELSDEETTLWRRVAVSAGGLGYLPVAPGTWGAAGAAGVALLLWSMLPPTWVIAALLVGIVLALVVGMWLCPWAEQYYGKKDPGTFVIDELAGQWLACALFMWAPDSALAGTAAAFIAFRVFDIIKPPPARKIEQLPGGQGTMLDDLVAALYAAATVWIIFRMRPSVFNYPAF